MPLSSSPRALNQNPLLLRVAPEHRFGIKDLSRGSRFYPSDYLQDSSDSVSEKASFSGKKSQKNDTIGYATLIAPEITSEIKPGMSGSLLCAHVGCYCIENLHYCILECVHECVHECCYCSVTGCPPVRSLVAIKGGRETFARSTNK